MADGETWWKAKIPPYKHVIASYGTAMAGLPSQIAFANDIKIHQAIPLFNNTENHGLNFL